MHSKLKLVAIVTVVAVLCVGVVALTTDFIWDANTANTSWVRETNWHLDSSYPQNANDNATIDAAGFLCTFDPGSDVTINDLTLGGASPTKRKLHLEDGTLTVTGVLTLNDYAHVVLDAAQTLTVQDKTLMSGSIWIDLTDVDFNAHDIVIEGPTTRLTMTESGIEGSVITGLTLTIDASAANAARSFRFDGGEFGRIDLGCFGKVTIKSDLDDDNHRAKFWLAAGHITTGNGAVQITIVGGDSPARRVELDLDVFWGGGSGVNGLTTMTGYVSIDLADDAPLGFGRLVIGPGQVKVVAGSNAALTSS